MVKIDIATNSTDLATRLGKLVALMPKEFMKAVNKTAVNTAKSIFKAVLKFFIFQNIYNHSIGSTIRSRIFFAMVYA